MFEVKRCRPADSRKRSNRLNKRLIKTASALANFLRQRCCSYSAYLHSYQRSLIVNYEAQTLRRLNNLKVSSVNYSVCRIWSVTSVISAQGLIFVPLNSEKSSLHQLKISVNQDCETSFNKLYHKCSKQSC